MNAANGLGAEETAVMDLLGERSRAAQRRRRERLTASNERAPDGGEQGSRKHLIGESPIYSARGLLPA
jgi:hypothetical protein